MTGAGGARRAVQAGWLISMLCWSAASRSQTDIAIDASFGRTPAALAASTPGTYEIPEALGRVSGKNLFHSFERFNIGSGDRANFTTQTTDLKNVITRVTGGSLSTIQGALQLSAPNAPSFFLINPAGIVFGPDAKLDLPGAFHLSTAHALNFADGLRWNSDSPDSSSLSAADPVAFGFLKNSVSPIMLSNRLADGTTTAPLALQLKEGSQWTFSAGDITLDGAVLSIPGGQVKVSALGNQTRDIAVRDHESYRDLSGTIQIINDGQINVRGTRTSPRGLIQIQGGSLRMYSTDFASVSTQSRLSANSTQRTAGHIEISLSDTLSLTRSALIESAGLSGTLKILAPRIELRGRNKDPRRARNGIRVFANAKDNASTVPGWIEIDSSEILIADGSEIYTRSEDRAIAGDIRIKADLLHIERSPGQNESAWINAGALGQGQGGTIRLDVDVIEIVGGAITASARANANSKVPSPGSIFITASRVVVDGNGVADFTNPAGILVNAEFGSDGFAGSLSIFADDIALSNKGKIAVESKSVFQDGVHAKPNSLTIGAQRIQLSSGGRITAETFSNVDGGDLRLLGGSDGTRNLTIESRDGTGFVSRSTQSIPDDGEFIRDFNNRYHTASGDAGIIDIKARDFTLDHVVLASEAGVNTGGAAGAVNISSSGTVRIKNGARLSTSTFDVGNAGQLTIEAERIQIEQAAVSSVADGRAVDVVRNWVFDDGTPAGGSGTYSNPFPERVAGKAGSIRIKAKSLLLRDAQITSASLSELANEAGDVRIELADRLTLVRSQVSTSVQSRVRGNGGNIHVQAQEFLLQTGFIQANTAAPTAAGGTVTVNAASIFGTGTLLVGGDRPTRFDPNLAGINVIQAASPQGISGDIRLSTPILDLASQIQALSTDQLPAVTLGRDLCRSGITSSFTPVGRGGLYPAASDWIRAEAALASLARVDSPLALVSGESNGALLLACN